MSYTLLIKKQAKKALQSVPQPDRTRITEKIVLLGENPDNAILDIKNYKANPIFAYVLNNGELFSIEITK